MRRPGWKCQDDTRKRAQTVGLDKQVSRLRITNFKLVAPFHESWNEDFPDTLVLMLTHRVTAPIPLVEVSDNAYTACIGRPYGKQGAFDLIDTMQAGAQQMLRITMLTGVKRIHVARLQLRPEAVWVSH